MVTDSILLGSPTGPVYGSSGQVLGTINYVPAAPVIWIDGQATTLPAQVGSGTVILPIPATLAPGLHTEQLIDGVAATSNAVTYLVDYNVSLLNSAINAELATADSGTAKKAKIDAMLGLFIGLGH